MVPRLVMTCTCGCDKDHVIARSETADGIKVSLWSSGDITSGSIGAFQIPGLGFASSLRSKWARECRAKAARLVWSCVGVYDLAELPTLIAAAASTYRHTYTSEEARRANAIRIADRRLHRFEGDNP